MGANRRLRWIKVVVLMAAFFRTSQIDSILPGNRIMTHP
jgi:hypothetical protein